MRRPGRLLIAAAIVLAIVIAWWLLRGRGDDATRPASEPAAKPPPPPPAPPPRLESVASVADERPADMQAPPARPAASPYPPGSQPLTEGSDPATTVPEDVPVDERGLHAVFGPRRDVVHPPDPIVIDLQVLDANGKRLAISGARAMFRGERATAATGAGPHAPFVDDGTGADRAANDLAYTATYTPSTADQRALGSFRVFVEVAFTVAGAGERRASTWVQYTPRPHAELSKRFAEHVDNGSLVVDVGVAVAQRGHYKVIASLYAADHTTALCFAQEARELDAGAQAIPLVFFGKILHDRGVDGPYVLRYAMLFEEFPDQGMYWPGVTVDDAYTTRAYRAADFSPAPYVAQPRDQAEVTADSPSQQGKPSPMFTR